MNEKRPIRATVWLCILLGIAMFSSLSLFAQGKGKQLFEKTCMACHKLTDQKLVGPGLKDVTLRHDSLWIRDFVRSSQSMIKAGDKAAVKLFEENNKLIMPDQALSDEEFGQLYTFLKDPNKKPKHQITMNVKNKEFFTHAEIRQGRKLFFGEHPFENGSQMYCNRCHNTNASDSMNFNPSAMDVAERWQAGDGTEFYEILWDPTSAHMEKAHEALDLSENEIHLISAYLSDVSKKGYQPHAALPVRLCIFLLVGVLMALALADLFFFKKVKFKMIHAAILIAGISVHSVMATQEGIALSRTPNYQPDQPIKFSHKIHAQQNKIECEYCHTGVKTDKSAVIPSANVCMNCHNVVREGSNSGKFEINKITDAIYKKASIAWIRIHKLPDHVFFSHAQHVGVGKIECEKCHGKVNEMHIVKQQEDLSMGWCVNCHRDTKVKFSENMYYGETFKALHDSIRSGKIKDITAARLGGLDCMKCHY